MRNQAGLLAIAALLGGCGSSDDATPVPTPSESAAPSPALPAPAGPEPDLAACPKAQPFDDSLRGRDGPVAAPPMMDGLVKSDMDHFAILTLSGKTVCIDTNWIETVSGARLTRDKRFLSFEWSGYEAFGFMVVDRSGAGTVMGYIYAFQLNITAGGTFQYSNTSINPPRNQLVTTLSIR